jgi:hypothetical protein
LRGWGQVALSLLSVSCSDFGQHLGFARWIGSFCEDDAEQGVEEAAIFPKRFGVVGRESRFDRRFRSGREEFDAADEYSSQARRLRINRERKDGVHDGTRHDKP